MRYHAQPGRHWAGGVTAQGLSGGVADCSDRRMEKRGELISIIGLVWLYNCGAPRVVIKKKFLLG